MNSMKKSCKNKISRRSNKSREKQRKKGKKEGESAWTRSGIKKKETGSTHHLKKKPQRKNGMTKVISVFLQKMDESWI